MYFHLWQSFPPAIRHSSHDCHPYIVFFPSTLTAIVTAKGGRSRRYPLCRCLCYLRCPLLRHRHPLDPLHVPPRVHTRWLPKIYRRRRQHTQMRKSRRTITEDLTPIQNILASESLTQTAKKSLPPCHHQIILTIARYSHSGTPRSLLGRVLFAMRENYYRRLLISH